MKTPSPIWEASYRHDRRFHRHRCRCCNRIINDGERVLMIRVRGYRNNKTWAIHVEPCAAKPFDVPGDRDRMTWRDAMTAWGVEHLRKCGWKIPQPNQVECA